MGRGIDVPITPSVLAWAIDRSGMSSDEVARAIKVDAALLAQWSRGESRPTLTAFKELAHVLRRPTATFLLPQPPPSTEPHVEFRHPPGVADRVLRPDERLRIREVHRVQDAVGLLANELGEPRPSLPSFSPTDDPDAVGRELRALIGASMTEQTSWRDVSVALRAWRRRVEGLGVLVFLLPMGPGGARGFSLWHERSPAIVINTHWAAAARIYTLFHELAHLVTGTSSLCAEDARPSERGSDLERWCERVAATVLMPAEDVKALVGNGRIDLVLVGRVATRFRVSLRASALRLINLELARWSLFKSLPESSDHKAGGGGGGRSRSQKRLDEYGHRTTRTFVRAVKRELITASEAMRYLDVGDHDLDELEKLAA